VYHRDSVHYWLTHRLYEGWISKRIPLHDVERSSIDAHPLVRVYSRREYRRVLQRAGFRHVRLAVRHYRPGDAYLLWGLQRRVRVLAAEPVNTLIGRAAGWYLCAAAS
jgi:hypothetical protein